MRVITCAPAYTTTSMAAPDISLAEKVTLALKLRFPGANLRFFEKGAILMVEFYEDNGSRHYYSTPPDQDYRQHDTAWLVHRFADLIVPAYAAAQVRGTLAQARVED